MTQRHQRLDFLAVALLVLLCASWGLLQVAIKVAMPSVPPIMQAAIRSFGATVLVYIWMAWKGEAVFARDGSLWLGIVAGLMFSAEFVFIYWGLMFTAASRAGIFIYMSPFVVALGSHQFVPGEYINRVQLSGLAAAFLGIIIAFKESLSFTDSMVLVGDSMMFLGAVLCGGTTVLIKASSLNDISPGKMLFYLLSVSSVMLSLASFIFGEGQITTLTPLVISSLAYQTIWVAFVTYLIWYWLVRHYPPSRLSSFTFLSPLFGLIAGALLLHEKVSPMLILSLLLVGLGIYLVNKKKNRNTFDTTSQDLNIPHATK